MRVKLVHFYWMQAYWSISTAAWQRLRECADNGRPFDLTAMGARELRSRPHGPVHRLTERNDGATFKE